MEKNDKLLNFREYLHLAFIFIVFILSVIFVDMDSDVERSQSILFIGFISLVYVLQLEELEYEYWNWRDEREDTNYQIVAPFGLVLIASWLAYADYNTPTIISKYSGFLILLTSLSAINIHSKINQRFSERAVSEMSVIVHKVVLWMFFIILYMIAAEYFISYGTWEWDIPSIKILFKQAFPELFYVV